MEKRTSAFARIFAVIALAAAIVAVIVVVSGGADEDPAKDGKQRGAQQRETTAPEKPKFTAATYEVKSGDTLTRISHLTGVKVTKLIELNPEIDPQILEVGAKLKLR
jgi:hypothetical protein